MLLWLLSVFDPTCRTWADTTYRIKQNTSYLYRPQRSWGKVMFLHVSVILFTGGGSSGPHPGEVEGSGLGAFPGPHQGGSPGPHLEGCLQANTWGGSPGPHQGGIAACTEADPQHAATAAGGTHPIGMHSCLFCFSS